MHDFCDEERRTEQGKSSVTCARCIVLVKLTRDTKHRAASLRQQSYLLSYLNKTKSNAEHSQMKHVSVYNTWSVMCMGGKQVLRSHQSSVDFDQ